MRCLISESSGVLLAPSENGEEVVAIDCVRGESIQPVELRLLYSTVQDWEAVEGSPDTLIEALRSEFEVNRTAALVRSVLRGLDEDLEREVLTHVQELFEEGVSSEVVLNRLLVAPLVSEVISADLTARAVASGLSHVASLLADLFELQPLLRRFTDLWLTLDPTLFHPVAEAKEEIWQACLRTGQVRKILEASTRRELEVSWNLLTFSIPSPESRSGIGVLGSELGRRLFPDEQMRPSGASQGEESDQEETQTVRRTSTIHEAYVRAEKEIDAISLAVSRGEDSKAEIFLRELIRRQTAEPEGETYAVKSLCKIAKRCADMFRTDFERLCLDEALRIEPSDSWALIQRGDHLKRIGEYDEALRVLRKAQELGERIVGVSSEADVYAQQGEYEAAIRVYKSMPDWQTIPRVHTGIADNLRRLRHLDESEKIYQDLIRGGRSGKLGTDFDEARYNAGLAEIAKHRGLLEEAAAIYRSLLEHCDAKERDTQFYRLGLCNVLKLKGEYGDAYTTVSEVISNYPFAMRARFIRASILGLMSKEMEGLEDLPEGSISRSWREWVRRFYRGLLLLRLKQFKEARKDLVGKFAEAIASKEDMAVLRMGAAVWFLGRDEARKANALLSHLPSLHDSSVEYLSLVLRLHAAVSEKNQESTESLGAQLAKLQTVDKDMTAAVSALDKGNFPLALVHETNALLKLAA